MYEVNRSVILVVPQEPFWQWLNSLPDVELDGVTLEDLQFDPNAYLVNPCEDIDEAWDMIEARLEEVFSSELADWSEDQTMWPDLHPDIFFEWFDIKLSTIVTDLSRADLGREPFEPLEIN